VLEQVHAAVTEEVVVSLTKDIEKHFDAGHKPDPDQIKKALDIKV
jgi:hypothetical protein